jgi:hypothetical protein
MSASLERRSPLSHVIAIDYFDETLLAGIFGH